MYEESDIDDCQENEFSIRPLLKKFSRIPQSFSTDFLMDKYQNELQRSSRSCYALSTADEKEELEYVSSRATSVHESEHNSIDKNESIVDEDDEEMSLSDDVYQEHSISDNENDEEADELDDDLCEFTTRRRSQLFIPHSKSDGQLLSAGMKRPLTPRFDESLNSDRDFIQFISNPTPNVIRHSATYSGQVAIPPTVRMSSGRSFIERLKERQKSKEAYKRKRSEPTISPKLPEDFVESFDIECNEQEPNFGTFLMYHLFNLDRF